MVPLVLSLDYEIFGNGAGDVRHDIICPTRRILEICRRYGARMTIMFEVGEYWAFERFDDLLRRNLGYSPCAQMREQVIEAVGQGHDVQLHLHPQWIDAEYCDGDWRLRNACWRLADLPDGLGDEEESSSITGILCQGKRTLEDMIRPLRSDYECICFRAGGFYAQPSGDIIHALKRTGLRGDSSVVKGYRTTEPFAVDYSRVEIGPSAWWTTDTELIEEGAAGENVLELSVSSRLEPYWRSFKLGKLRAAAHRWRRERGSPGGVPRTRGNGISSVPSCRTVWKKILSRHASTLDFCKLSSRDMLHRLRELETRGPQPVVMIGHSKDFVNDRQLERFLAAISRRGTVRFAGMSEYVREVWSGLGVLRSIDTVDVGIGR